MNPRNSRLPAWLAAAVSRAHFYLRHRHRAVVTSTCPRCLEDFGQ